MRVRVRVRPHPSQAGIAQALVSAGCEGSEGGSDEAREAVFAEALAAYGTYEEQLAGAIEQQEQLVEALRTANDGFTRARMEETGLEQRHACSR